MYFLSKFLFISFSCETSEEEAVSKALGGRIKWIWEEKQHVDGESNQIIFFIIIS